MILAENAMTEYQDGQITPRDQFSGPIHHQARAWIGDRPMTRALGYLALWRR